MGVFDYIKKIFKNQKKSLEDNQTTKLGKLGIKVGQVLFYQNGDKVIVREVKKATIIVECKLKNYEIEFDAIGKTLFISKPTIERYIQKQSMIQKEDLLRKHEEEKRLHAQRKEQIKQDEERKRLLQLEEICKQNEERREQEQQELIKKQDQERRLLSQIEELRKQNTELRHQLQIEKKSKQEERRQQEQRAVMKNQEERYVEVDLEPLQRLFNDAAKRIRTDNIRNQEEKNKRLVQIEQVRKQEEEHRLQEQRELIKKQEEERRQQEQRELIKKQEEERRQQEQRELIKKQEERRQQEQKELIKKREEEYRQQKQKEKCKRQEQKEKVRKLDEERIRHAKIELQKRKEKELRRNKEIEQLSLEKLRKNEIEVDGFKKNETIIYHDVFGKGKFIRFENDKTYICIKFEKKSDIARFIYPDSIGEHLFLQMNPKMSARELFLEDPKNKKIDDEEKEFFDYVCKVADNSLSFALNERSMISYGYNDFSDSFDSEINNKFQKTTTDVELWTQIRNNPYFARVDYGNKKEIYIGKNQVNELVIDWREKICILYYKYNLYIGNKDYDLSLVRDFDIISGWYCGFVDKYSKKINSRDNNITEDVISDEFLIKVISVNREDKNTHDIIQTIQRNQYEMITFNTNKNMIVLGCAGSGKTMIMFHRLSYILFNYKDVDIKSIYIISPTKLLNLESDELSKTLKINNSNRMTITSFNSDIIKQYYEINQAYNSNTFSQLKSNNTLNEEFIKKVYSEIFYESFEEEITDTILYGMDNYNDFVRLEELRLLNEYFVFLDDKSKYKDVFVADGENKLLRDIFENITQAVAKVPWVNALEKIRSLENTIKSTNNKNKTLLGKVQVLNCLVNNWEMSSNVIFNNKNSGENISIDDTIFTEVFGYFNVLGKGNSKNKNIIEKFPHLKGRFNNALHLINEYKNMNEKVKRFNEFKKGSVKNYFSEVINQLILKLKKSNGISLQDTYEFEACLHLVGCKVLFGILHNKKTYLFVDEFQDYAFTEINLYKKILPNATLNLFGDVKQSINVKGINMAEMEGLTDNSWKKFIINENYRNAQEITQYVNSAFNLNMMPIGIKGVIENHNISEISIKINKDTTDRNALIVKDIKYFEEIILSKIKYINEEEINIINDENCLIKKGYINIIPIILAKGLEFENVYVVPDEMTENEKYVAYTRALSKLFILK